MEHRKTHTRLKKSNEKMGNHITEREYLRGRTDGPVAQPFNTQAQSRSYIRWRRPLLLIPTRFRKESDAAKKTNKHKRILNSRTSVSLLFPAGNDANMNSASAAALTT